MATRIWRSREARRERQHVRKQTPVSHPEQEHVGGPVGVAYASTSEEGQQDPVVAHLMADGFLLSYIDDKKVTEPFNGIRKGYSP